MLRSSWLNLTTWLCSAFLTFGNACTTSSPPPGPISEPELDPGEAGGAGHGVDEAGSLGSIDATSEVATVPAFDAGGALMPQPLEDNQRAYVDLRFGMFLHFGILTYTGTWSQPNLDITQFNPTKLDPGQWADAALAAHMKFVVLTTRNHDGFALWPTPAITLIVGHVPWLHR